MSQAQTGQMLFDAVDSGPAPSKWVATACERQFTVGSPSIGFKEKQSRARRLQE